MCRLWTFLLGVVLRPNLNLGAGSKLADRLVRLDSASEFVMARGDESVIRGIDWSRVESTASIGPDEPGKVAIEGILK